MLLATLLPAALAAEPAGPASLRVGPLTDDTRQGELIGDETLLPRLEVVLEERQVPLVAAGTESLAVTTAAVLTGTVAEEACHRELHWTGCRWRVQWTVRDGTSGDVWLTATTTSEVAVSRSVLLRTLRVDLAERALLPLARSPQLTKALEAPDPEEPRRVDLSQAPSPLTPPIGPGRPTVRWIDAPGARDLMLGGGLLTGSALITLPTVMHWSSQASGFDTSPTERAVWASLTAVGIGVGIGGGLLLRRGLKARSDTADEAGVEVVLAPSGVGVRGRF